MRAKVIACRVLIDEMRSFLPADMETEVFELSQHIRPKQLRQDLQAAINRIDGSCDAILLGYGLCSNAVIGLCVQYSQLVIPKMHDCIGVLLGSHRAYVEEMALEPAFFLTHGYIQAYLHDKSGPMDEYERVAKRFGGERAKRVVDRMMRPYRRLVYIRTAQAEDIESDRQYTHNMATQFGMLYEEKHGTSEILRRIVQGQWNSDFVVVQPGNEVRLDHFFDCMAAAPR